MVLAGVRVELYTVIKKRDNKMLASDRCFATPHGRWKEAVRSANRCGMKIELPLDVHGTFSLIHKRPPSIDQYDH